MGWTDCAKFSGFQKRKGMGEEIGPYSPAPQLPGTEWSFERLTAQEAKAKNSWKWANLLISGHVCTREQATKHPTPSSPFVGGCCDPQPQGRTLQPQLWPCCSKMAGKALHQALRRGFSWDVGNWGRSSDWHSREAESCFSQMPFCLHSSNSPNRMWVTVIRQGGYLSSLHRNNDLGKLTAGFCSPQPIFKVRQRWGGVSWQG